MSEYGEVEEIKYIAGFVASEDDTEWISPSGIKESRRYLTALPDRYQDGELELIGDIGCGAGELTGELAQKYPEADVIGLDISYKAAEQADRYNRDNDNVAVIGGDALQILPWFDDFDMLYSINMIQNTPRPIDSLTALAHNVRPGGHLVVTAPGNEGVSVFEDFAKYDAEQDLPYLSSDNANVGDATVQWKQYMLPEERLQEAFDRLNLELLEKEQIPANVEGLSFLLEAVDLEEKLSWAEELKQKQEQNPDAGLSVNSYLLERR